MNGLIVKNVDMFGDTVMAAKDKDGNIWAGVSYFCKALGMTNKQRDNQVSKVQSDKILNKGTLKFREGVFDPNNEVIAIKIDFIPLWLAKITITKKMEQEHPELADKLLDYQLKAKDILAEAFLPKNINNVSGTKNVYNTKSTSLGEVASFVKEMDKRLEKQGTEPWKICEAFKMISEQFGVKLPKDFVKVPEYEQLTLSTIIEKN